MLIDCTSNHLFRDFAFIFVSEMNCVRVCMFEHMQESYFFSGLKYP